jgi:hypothetical protein
MANEAQVTAILTFAKGNIAQFQRGTSAQNVNVSGTKFIHNVMTVPTTKTALALGSVGTPGYCYMRNQDSTNFVTIYPDNTGNAVIKLKAGECAVFRLGTTTPYALADTASVALEYYIVED